MTNWKQRAVLIVAQIIIFSLIVVPIAAAIPTNDDLGGAIVVADDYSATIDTTGATFATTDPAPSCNTTGDTLTWSVWYQFDAAYTGKVYITSRLPWSGTAYNQYITLYEITDPVPPATIGAELGCSRGVVKNDEFLSVTAGKTYAVQISSVDGNLGKSLTFEFQTTATLQGAVTDEVTTAPLGGIVAKISNTNAPPEQMAVAFTSSTDGTWSAIVPTQPILIEFVDSSGTYGSEYYNNVTTTSAATTPSPATQTTVSGIDAALSSAASLSGTVTDSSGNPIPGSLVYVYDTPYTGTYKTGMTTDSSGNFTFTSLNAGDYLLKFDADGYYGEWWNDMPDPASATTVSLVAGANTGFNAQLVKEGRITGTVTDDLGQPISGVKVIVRDGPSSIYSSPITATDGSYIIAVVPPGEYTVYADANFPVTGAYGSEWWDDLAPSTAYADVGKIAIVDGTIAVADFSLNRSVLAGTVTSADDGLPIEGVVVTVTNDAATQLAQMTTDAGGAYSFVAFPFDTPPLQVSFTTTGLYFLDGATTNVAFSAGANVTVDKALDPDPKAPTIGSELSFSLGEDVPVGTVVGTLTGTDLNRGDTLTWSITSGNAAGAFTIDPVTGAITTATALDYETTRSYLLGVDLSDGSAQDTATVFVGVTDIVEYRVVLVDPSQGRWHLFDSSGTTTTSFYFGNPGDFPIMGDWDGDGVKTPGMYRQSDGYVYLRNTNSQGIADLRFFFGNPGDVPIAGDFNGDGFDTVSIYRPSNQTFYIINELGANDGGLGAAELSYVFGNPGDKPFVGDFDGDGVDTVGLHRESTGLVYFRNTHAAGNADAQFIFGDPGDRIVAGDWNGNGTSSPALFRPSSTTIYLRYTNTQGNADEQFLAGRAGWIPVSGR